jgi:DnaK suppressor protein
MAEQLHSVVRAQLEDEQARLRAQLQEHRHDDSSLSFDDGFADSSQVTAERGELDAIAGRLDEMLKDVEDALAKLDDGSYGRCESCGGPIGDARLEAMPAARLCISCASKSR